MFDPEPMQEFEISEHALFEMDRRGIKETVVAAILAAPEQVALIRPGRAVYQSKVGVGAPPSIYLLRIIVDFDRQPPKVVTAYLTSKIAKYWRTEE